MLANLRRPCTGTHRGHARSSHCTRTWLNCRTKHEQTCGNSAQNRYTQQMQRAIVRMGLSLGPHSSKRSPHAKVERADDMPSTMPPRACEGGKGVRGGVRERVDMRQGDEGGMEEDTTGLRGVATSARGGHTCVAAGRWRVDDRPPRTPPEGKPWQGQDGGHVGRRRTSRDRTFSRARSVAHPRSLFLAERGHRARPGRRFPDLGLST